MVEASIRARGASSNALGGYGFVQDVESDGTRAKSFRAFSTNLVQRALNCRVIIGVRNRNLQSSSGEHKAPKFLKSLLEGLGYPEGTQ